MKMSLRGQLASLTEHNKDNSFATRQDRNNVLFDVVDILKKNFRLESLQNLKEKHITHIVEEWKISGITNATIKNRMSHLRWLAEKLNKKNMIPAKNSALGIANRATDSNTDKSWIPSQELYANLPEPLQIHVDLMRHFGLRFREAALFRPKECASTQEIDIEKGTKGGRPRSLKFNVLGEDNKQKTVDVHEMSDAQIDVVSRATEYVHRENQDCLIPKNVTYKKWEDSTRNTYSVVGMTKDGVGTPHGLRHHYAQERYRALTGWKTPAEMSTTERSEFRKNMTKEMKAKDISAKKTISTELGHGRVYITSTYVGSWSITKKERDSMAS